MTVIATHFLRTLRPAIPRGSRPGPSQPPREANGPDTHLDPAQQAAMPTLTKTSEDQRLSAPNSTVSDSRQHILVGRAAPAHLTRHVAFPLGLSQRQRRPGPH